MDYKQSGVNIDEGNRAVELIKETVQSTHTKHVMGSIGGFAAGFRFPTEEYKEPILVSCTDGVGTKVRYAIDSNIFNTIGIDCVAMCVNDLICMGAKPLFFLDYIACHEIIPDNMSEIIKGIANGCKESECALIGGEMAEMNDMYKKKDFDLAGFCVGVVDKPSIIDGSSIGIGQHIYALPSSGIHSNGFSLVRKVMNETSLSKDISIESLLTPTRIYVKQIQKLISMYKLSGIAHITGGGIQENLNRVLPKNMNAEIIKDSIIVNAVFKPIQEHGNIAEEEMFRVFNMGVGMVVVSDDDIPESEGCYKIGTIVDGSQEVYFV